MQTRLGSKPKLKYSLGPYNKIKGDVQRIRLTEGCPHNCPYCYEPFISKIFKIPKIKREIVEISDMNLLSKPEAIHILKKLPIYSSNKKRIEYELICGVDYRFLDQRIAEELKHKHFVKMRLAWDWGMDQQYKIKDSISMLIKAGYDPKTISVFMICNWKISYEECLQKLDLLKIWNVKVNDCYFDNQVSPNIKPIDWTKEQIKAFRKKCRKHNHLVRFGIDPEVK